MSTVVAGLFANSGVAKVQRELAAGLFANSGVAKVQRELAAGLFANSGVAKVQRELAAGLFANSGIVEIQRELAAGIFRIQRDWTWQSSGGIPGDLVGELYGQLEVESSDVDESAALRTNRAGGPSVGRRELAVYITTVVFFVTYICFAELIRRDPAIHEVSQVDGPSPFDAAMALGALTFWLVMKQGKND